MPRTRNSSHSFGETVNHLGTVSQAVAANADDLPHLQERQQRLETVVRDARTLLTEQKAQAATKQESSLRLEALVVEGERIGTFLKSGVREHYGRGAEKLVEFDIQPLRSRGRRRVTPPPPPAPETPEVAETGAQPVTATD